MTRSKSSDLQIEYSLLSRGIEDEILRTCRELGVGITAYGVLSRGLLSGHWSLERAATAGSFRQSAPRFTGENLARNLALVEALRSVAGAKGATVAHLAIAWVLSRGEDIVPLVGARRRDQLAEALGATEVQLSAEDLEAIERAVPAGTAAGDRYHAPQMATLDSERGRGDLAVSETALTSERILETAEDVLRRFGPAKATSTSPGRST